MSHQVEYDSADIFVQSKPTLKGKIAAIDAIITALETSALKSAATGNLDEYWLDDGQTRIKTIYRSVDDVADGIVAFMKIRQIYVNRLNGRVVRMVDGKNFHNRRNGR